jgi:hypothetical protein
MNGDPRMAFGHVNVDVNVDVDVHLPESQSPVLRFLRPPCLRVSVVALPLVTR